MGLRVTTDEKHIKIYRKDIQYDEKTMYLYSTLIKSSQGAGTGQYNNDFLNVQFRKGVVIPNKSIIKIKDAFLSSKNYKGKADKYIMVLDFEIIEKGEETVVMSEDSFMNIPVGVNDELPFE